MSTSHAIAIPKRRKHPQPELGISMGMGMGISLSPSTSSSSNSHACSMASSAPASGTTSTTGGISTTANTSSTETTTPSSVGGRRRSMAYRSSPGYGHERRPSLLSSSISKSEHTVVNIGDADSPRLITCIKASQGFDWNQDLFLPSYADYDGIDLETRQDPVEDIVLTEEEIEAMFPR